MLLFCKAAAALFAVLQHIQKQAPPKRRPQIIAICFYPTMPERSMDCTKNFWQQIYSSSRGRMCRITNAPL